MSDRALKRVVRLYWGNQFFFSLLVWLPIFYEYQRRTGLDDAQIFSIQSIYYAAFCLLEIPTGLVADRWGPRRCLRWGAGTLFASNLLPIFRQTYEGFLVHFLLIALARAFVSGAANAFLYEYLARRGAQSEFKQIEGKGRAYGLFGKMLFWGMAGLFMEWHFTLPYWLTVVSACLAFAMAWAMPDVKTASGDAAPVRFLRRFSDMVGLLARSPYLLLVMLQGVAVFVLTRICQVNLLQPILGEKSFSLAFYGYMMAVMTLFEAVGSWAPNWVRRWLTDLSAVFVLTLVMAATLTLVVPHGRVGTTLALSVFAYAMGLSYPIQRQLLNDAIPDSRHRATLLSVESIIDRAISAWVASSIGVFLTRGRLDAFLLLSGAVTAVAMAVLFAALKLGGFSPRRVQT